MISPAFKNTHNKFRTQDTKTKTKNIESYINRRNNVCFKNTPKKKEVNY